MASSVDSRNLYLSTSVIDGGQISLFSENENCARGPQQSRKNIKAGDRGYDK
jgi:hypothetical protein